MGTATRAEKREHREGESCHIEKGKGCLKPKSSDTENAHITATRESGGKG